MRLVIDASVALAWSFEDERTPRVNDVLDQVVENGAIVPGIWPLEVANGFRMAVRRGRIDIEFRHTALNRLGELSIEIDAETNTHAWASTLALADRHGLTPYDASYLDLALRQRRTLATLDASLRRAAVAERVDVATL